MTTIFVGQSLNEILKTMGKSGVGNKSVLICGKTDEEWRICPTNNQTKIKINCGNVAHISA